MPWKFAPNDDDIPLSLKIRIGSWKKHTPSSQFQQYGPLNKYLHLKFNRETHIIKPQCLFRTPIDTNDDHLAVDYGVDQHDPLPSDDEDPTKVQDIRDNLEAGNISIDSTHPGFVASRSAAGERKYPDFAVCEQSVDFDPRGVDADSKDVVRVVIEVASRPRGINESQLAELQEGTLEQLLGYMENLGEEGDRWRDNVLGIALIGTSVAFIKPDRRQGRPGDWVQDKGRNGRSKVWCSLYGSRFTDWIERACNFCHKVQ